MNEYEMVKLLSEFGGIPKNQVQMIWNIGYECGHKRGKSVGYSNAVDFAKSNPEAFKELVGPTESQRDTDK